MTDRADVYALGALLWHLSTGQTPWDLDRQGAADWPTVPRALAAAIERATRWDPRERPIAAELHRALIAASASLTVDPDLPPLVPLDAVSLPPPPPPTVPPPAPPRPPRIAAGIALGRAVAALAGWWATRGPRFELVPRPEATGPRIYAPDGHWYTVEGLQVVRVGSDGARMAMAGCLADRLLDADDGRLLLWREGTLRVSALPDCRSEATVPPADVPGPIYRLDPRGGVLVLDDHLRADATGRVRVLTAVRRPLAMAVSPSGRTVAWIANPDRAGSAVELALFDRDAGLQRTLLRDGTMLQVLGEASLAFLDEDRLAFARSAGGTGTEISALDLRTGSVSSLGAIDSGPITLERTASGLWLSSAAADYDIAGIGPGGPASAWVTHRGSDRPSDLADDGSLLFSSDRDGTWDVWQRDPDGTERVVVGGPPHDAWAVLAGDRLVWLRTWPDQAGVVAVMIRSGGEDRELVRFPVESSFRLRGRPPPATLRLDCNASTCIVCLLQDPMEVMPLDPTTGVLGPGRDLTDQRECALGPDGTVIATGPDSATLVFRFDDPVTRSSPLAVQQASPVEDGRWLVSGRPSSDAAFTIRWVRPDGSEPVLVAASDEWLGEPRASPDGRWAAWLVSRSVPAGWELVERRGR